VSGGQDWQVVESWLFRVLAHKQKTQKNTVKED